MRQRTHRKWTAAEEQAVLDFLPMVTQGTHDAPWEIMARRLKRTRCSVVCRAYQLRKKIVEPLAEKQKRPNPFDQIETFVSP